MCSQAGLQVEYLKVSAPGLEFIRCCEKCKELSGERHAV